MGAAGAHLMLGQLGQRAAHMLLQPVQGHRRLVGQDIDALSELVCDWVQDQQSGVGVRDGRTRESKRGCGRREPKLQTPDRS